MLLIRHLIKETAACYFIGYCICKFFFFSYVLKKSCKYKLNFVGNKITQMNCLFSQLDGAKCSLSGEVIKKQSKKIIEVKWIDWKLYLIRWNRGCFTFKKWSAVEKGEKIGICDIAELNISHYRDKMLLWGVW